MRLQTVVQHDPRRAHLLPALLPALPAGAKVVADPGAADARRDPWRCYLACLRALDPFASHLLIVQDDALPCRDLSEALERIVPRHPAAALVLFTPGVGIHASRVLDACRAGKRFAELASYSFLPAVATIWPAEYVASILAFSGQRGFAESQTADDGNLAEWWRAERASVLATVPSLVEHPDHEPSLVGKHHMRGRNPARIAACWMGEASPLDLDW